MTSYNVEMKVKDFWLTRTLFKEEKEIACKGYAFEEKWGDILITIIIILAEWKIELWVS